MPNTITNVGELGWNRLMVDDPNNAKAFYGSLFGWESYDVNLVDDEGIILKYTVFTLGNKNIAGMFKTPPNFEGNVKPHWLSFITVKDIHATIEKAVKLGGALNIAVRTIETIGYIALMTDPSGAHIGFFEPL